MSSLAISIGCATFRLASTSTSKRDLHSTLAPPLRSDCALLRRNADFSKARHVNFLLSSDVAKLSEKAKCRKAVLSRRPSRVSRL